MDLENYPWMEDDVDNGFRVYVSPVPYIVVQSLKGAPDGAETFVKVVASKRTLATNCVEYNHLNTVWNGGEGWDDVSYYDPEGSVCVRHLVTMMSKYTSCLMPGYTFR